MPKSNKPIRKRKHYTLPFSEIPKIGPPKPSEIEVCVFGPKYGECIVVHLGNGHWMVVDSCIFEDAGTPSALAYFDALKIDPSAAIKVIVATHWHDDHYKGLSKIIKAAPDAKICIPMALTRPEFLKFAKRMAKNKSAVTRVKLDEFSATIDEIRDRNEKGSVNFAFADVRKLLYSLPPDQSGHGFPCEVKALSPSEADLLNFLERVARLTPQRRTTKRSISSAEPNEVSIVTLIKIGDSEILLAGDLENSGGDNSGLEGIVANHRTMPFGNGASLYKVGHHGSETAYNTDIWNELLTKDPHSVLTPWRKGGGRLPTREGVNAIVQHSTEAFITASDARARAGKRNRPLGVTRQLRDSDMRLRSLTPPFGAVRFRMSDWATRKWNIELFGDASHLKQFVKRKAAA
jgi:Metallo-beta-lactamase superfamily